MVNQGVLGTITAQLRGGEVTLKELSQIAANTAVSLNPWRFAIGGLVGQLRSGECSVVEVLRFITDSARGSQIPYHGGMTVWVIVKVSCPHICFSNRSGCFRTEIQMVGPKGRLRTITASSLVCSDLMLRSWDVCKI